jgi:hypothetical protein
MASEVGVVDVPAADVARKGRLMPGNIFLIDFDEHRVVEDKEVSEEGLPEIVQGLGLTHCQGSGFSGHRKSAFLLLHV